MTHGLNSYNYRPQWAGVLTSSTGRGLRDFTIWCRRWPARESARELSPNCLEFGDSGRSLFEEAKAHLYYIINNAAVVVLV